MARQIPKEPPKSETPSDKPQASSDQAPQKPQTKPIITDYASL